MGLSLLNEINQRIDEELGISSMVQMEARRVSKELLSEISKAHKTLEDDGVGKKEGSYTVNIFGNLGNDEYKRAEPVKVIIVWSYYNFRDNHYRSSFLEKKEIYGGGESVFIANKQKRNQFWADPSKYDSGYIWMVILSTSGHIDTNSLYDTIAHEFLHLYEQTIMGKNYNISLSDIAKQFLGSENHNERLLANYIYLTDKNEVDAIMNGLYAFVKHEEYHCGIYTAVKESDAAKKLCYVRDYKDELMNLTQEEIEEILPPYNINYNQLIRLINEGYTYMLKKFGRAYIKCISDSQLRGNFNRNIFHINEFALPERTVNNFILVFPKN